MVSKYAAARWGRDTLPARWREAIDAAIRAYAGDATPHRIPPMPVDHGAARGDVDLPRTPFVGKAHDASLGRRRRCRSRPSVEVFEFLDLPRVEHDPADLEPTPPVLRDAQGTSGEMSQTVPSESTAMRSSAALHVWLVTPMSPGCM